MTYIAELGSFWSRFDDDKNQWSPCCFWHGGCFTLPAFCHTAFAWQQEYIVSDAQSNTTERYTWDADHQPRYEDILAERINRTQNATGFTLNDPSGSDAETVLSVGWNFPVAGHFTTGPVMAWRTDGAPVTVNAFEDTTTTQSLTDPLWHASVNSLGWRVDTQYGDLHRAKISYNQQTEEEYLYTLGLSAKF